MHKTYASKFTDDDIHIGQLKNGKIRVQLVIPAECIPGERLKMSALIEDWFLAEGGIAIDGDLEWKIEVRIVDKIPTRTPPTPKVQPNKDKKKVKTGPLVAVIWKDNSKFEDWNGRVPGEIQNIRACDLAENPEYVDLKELGEREIPTIWLNEDFRPLKKYTQSRVSKGASETAVNQARDRYALGFGVALLELNSHKVEVEAKGKLYDDEYFLNGKYASAQGIIAMLPEYDSLIEAAGIDQ